MHEVPVHAPLVVLGQGKFASKETWPMLLREYFDDLIREERGRNAGTKHCFWECLRAVVWDGASVE